MARARVSVHVTAKAFAAIARDLRKAGQTQLRRELYAGLQRSGRPAIDAVRASARSQLPRTGGLAERVASSNIRVTSRGGARNPSIRVVAKERKGRNVDLAALDAGTVRHPLYGNRRYWYSQPVTPQWFTRPLQDQAPAVLRDLDAAVRRVLDQIGRG